MHRPLGTATLAVICAMMIGCSSDDSPTSSGGTTGRTIKSNPAFATDIQEIFDRRGCSASNCHGAAKASSLDLRIGASHSQLVGKAVSQTSGTRVIINNAQDSYLVMKIEGRQTIGLKMPITGPMLDSIDIQNIRNWIDTGAPNN